MESEKKLNFHFDEPIYKSKGTPAMNLVLDNNPRLLQLQDAWNTLGEEAVYMSHYDLAEATKFDATEWRMFITNPEVSDWIKQEMALIQQAKTRLLIKDIDGNTKSTGLPQLINTLAAQNDRQAVKEGPIFIYTYVPPNEQEQGAPNVKIAESNPFTVPVPKR